MALTTTATDTASGWLTFPSAPLGMRNIWNHSINKRRVCNCPHTRQSVSPVKIKSGIVFQSLSNVSSRLSRGSSSDPEKVHLGTVRVFLSSELKFIRYPLVAQSRLFHSGNSSSVSIHRVPVMVSESLFRYSSSAMASERGWDLPVHQGYYSKGPVMKVEPSWRMRELSLVVHADCNIHRFRPPVQGPCAKG